MTSATTTLPGDVAAVWEVHQSDGIHTIKFEHGTTSGKRVIIVDGEEVRKLWDGRCKRKRGYNLLEPSASARTAKLLVPCVPWSILDTITSRGERRL